MTGRCPRGRTSPSWAEGSPKASPSPPTRPPKEVCLSLRVTTFHNLKILKFCCHFLPIILNGYVAQPLNTSNCTNDQLVHGGSIHFYLRRGHQRQAPQVNKSFFSSFFFFSNCQILAYNANFRLHQGYLVTSREM